MSRLALRALVGITLLVLSLLSLQPLRALADEPFLMKWPWAWTTSVSVNTLPYQGEHNCGTGECTDAFDFAIADKIVRSSTEGVVTAQQNGVMTCSTKSGGLGNFAKVTTAGAPDLLYGHMVAMSVVPLQTSLLQGDEIGVQDGTGHVDPCPQNGHLHFEFVTPTPPAHVDGETTVPLQGPNSTNSIIGEYSTEGAALRGYYTAHGGWKGIGWTTEHCPGACTLNMTANLSWGRMQDFANDPDGFGGTFDTIGVPNWDPANAHLVDSVFWAAWASGGAGMDGVIHPLSMPLQDRGACPPGSTAACISFQHFHLGYVWMDVFTGRTAVFCPDIAGGPGVDLDDAIYVLQQFGSTTTPLADVDGDNSVDLSDYTLVLAEFGASCLP